MSFILVTFVFSSGFNSSNILRFLRKTLLTFRTRLLESEFNLLLKLFLHWSEQNFLSLRPLMDSPQSKHIFSIAALILLPSYKNKQPFTNTYKHFLSKVNEYPPTIELFPPLLCSNKFILCKSIYRLTFNFYFMRNKVQLIGNLGSDPEVKESEGGKTFTRFSIATSEKYTNQKGEKITDTQWHNVVAWGKTAENMGKYLKKGNEVALEGKLTNRSYDDKEGNKKYITEVLVNEFLMLGKADK